MVLSSTLLTYYSGVVHNKGKICLSWWVSGNVMMSKTPKCNYSNATETLGRHARDSVSKMLWHYQTLC